jgi:adenylate kinase family enzyme
MKIFEVTQSLSEGPNDPHIFKAVFMAGGPGSGKSFVAGKLFKGTGLRMVNSDDIYEYMMQKRNLPLDPETIFSPQGQEIRNKAKEITKRKQSSHIDGRLGLIIDGTGKDVQKVSRAKEMLKELGYDTMMLFVNTSLDVAQDRNLQRPRSLEPKQVEKMWNAVQQNIMAFQQVFGAGNFYVIDNSGGLEDKQRAENFKNVEKSIDKFLSSPPSSRAAKQWLADQKSQDNKQ